MKYFLIITSIIFIVGCGKQSNRKMEIITSENEIRLVFSDPDSNKTITINEINTTKSIDVNKPIKKHLKLESIYQWEYMYLYLDKYYMDITKHTDIKLNKYLKEIFGQRTSDLKIIEKIFESQKIVFDEPELSLSGEIDFKNENINKVFNLFKGAKNKKEVYENLCIGYNSIIYKYSKLVEEESHEYNKYSFSTMENENIDRLLLIDDTLKKMGVKGCCEVANILCDTKK